MQAGGGWRRWSRQGQSGLILGGREVDLATRGGQGSTLSLEAEGGEGQEVDSEGQGVGVMVGEGEVTGEEMGDMGEALDVVVAAMEEVKGDMATVVVVVDMAVVADMAVVVDLAKAVVVLVAVMAAGEDEEELGHSKRRRGIFLFFC